MDDKLKNECTHNCHICGSACSTDAKQEGFFDKIESISNQLDEDEVLKILGDTVSQWEKEMQEDEEA